MFRIVVVPGNAIMIQKREQLLTVLIEPAPSLQGGFTLIMVLRHAPVELVRVALVPFHEMTL